MEKGLSVESLTCILTAVLVPLIFIGIVVAVMTLRYEIIAENKQVNSFCNDVKDLDIIMQNKTEYNQVVFDCGYNCMVKGGRTCMNSCVLDTGTS